MSKGKVLTDRQLGEIIQKATTDPYLIDCADSYEAFLEDLTDLICDHFGGSRKKIIRSEDSGSDWFAVIELDLSVPDDGGVYKDYDKNTVWKKGKETSK